MRKVFILLFFVSSLFALNYSKCQKILEKSFVNVGYSYGVAVTDHLLLYASDKIPVAYKIVKHDRHIGVYLLKSDRKLNPIKLRQVQDRVIKQELAAITPYEIKVGKIVHKQNGMEILGEFSKKIKPNSIISNVCYLAYGIGIRGKTFLNADRIKRLIKESYIYYGDIGVRLDDSKKNAIVKYVDPFYSKNPFYKGDRVVAINNKNVDSKNDFYDKITNLPLGSTIKVEVIRSDKRRSFNVKVDERYGGGLLTDTFFERFGVSFEITPKGIKITDKSNVKDGRLKWISPGDTIVSIDRKMIKSQSDLVRYLTDTKEGSMTLLIHRGGFDFFTKVKLDRLPYD